MPNETKCHVCKCRYSGSVVVNVVVSVVVGLMASIFHHTK